MVLDPVVRRLCERAPFWCRHRLPSIHAIYLVLSQTCDVLYIGATRNLHVRWIKGHHHLDDFLAERGVCIAWFTPKGDLFGTERALIALYKPPFNKQMWQERLLRLNND